MSLQIGKLKQEMGGRRAQAEAVFEERLRQAWKFWTQTRANMHEKLCVEVCACLTDEQIKQAVLAGCAEPTRPLAVALLAKIV
jgi:hypothetical protein